MRDRCVHQRHVDHVAASTLGGLADRIRYTTRLADAHAYAPAVIADADNRAEGEATPALDDLGDARDVQYALVKLFTFLYTGFTSSHVSLQLQCQLSRGNPGVLR